MSYKYVISPKSFAGLYAYSASNMEIRLQPSFENLNESQRQSIINEAISTREEYVRLVKEAKEKGEKPVPAKFKEKAEQHSRQFTTDTEAIAIYENKPVNHKPKEKVEKKETPKLPLDDEIVVKTSEDKVPVGEDKVPVVDKVKVVGKGVASELANEFNNFLGDFGNGELVIEKVEIESNSATYDNYKENNNTNQIPESVSFDDDPFSGFESLEGEIKLP